MLTTSFKHIKLVSISWGIYWSLAVGFLSIVLKPMGYDYNSNAFTFSCLYFFFAFVGIKTFKSNIFVFSRIRESNLLLFFVIPTLIYGVVSLGVESFNPMSKEQVIRLKDIGILFPLFNIETYLAKLSDIIFQQLMMFTLVLGLEKEGFSHKKIITSFTFTFLVLHLPLVFIFKSYGFVFIIPAAIAGAIFSFLILKFKQGLMYSVIVHQGFYLILGILMRKYI